MLYDVICELCNNNVQCAGYVCVHMCAKVNKCVFPFYSMKYDQRDGGVRNVHPCGCDRQVLCQGDLTRAPRAGRSNPIVRMRTSNTRVFYVSQLQLHRKTATPQKKLCTVCERTPESYLHIILPYHPATPPQTCICTIKLNMLKLFSLFLSLFVYFCTCWRHILF